MTLHGSTYKRLLLVIILALWAVAFAMAQGGIVVSEGETRTYQVDNHAGSTYLWVVYNEPTFTTVASNEEVVIVSGGNTSSIILTWHKPGTYYPKVVETDQTGCTNTKAVVIVVNPGTIPWPVAKISNTTVAVNNLEYILTGSCRPLLIDASSSTGEGLIFQWEPSAYLDNPNSSTPIFSGGVTTTYQLKVTDIYGHSNTLPVGVMVSPAVKADAGQDLYVDANQSVLLDGSKSSGENLTYLWQTKNGHFQSGISSAHPIVDQAGKYLLTVTDQNGCTDRDSVLVSLYTQAIKDTANTLVNIPVNINVLTNDIPKNNLDPSTLRITQSPANGIAVVLADSLISYSPNQYFVGSDAFLYSICDYFQNCDEGVVLVLINDVPFFIPQAFSPNGDGINDLFEIKGLEKYKAVKIEIFNRWGNIVFQSNNYGDGIDKDGFWDGNGQSRLGNKTGPVPTGSYYYVLKMNGKENISGSIYIDR